MNDKILNTDDAPSQQAYTFVMMPVRMQQNNLEPKSEKNQSSEQVLAGIFWACLFLLATWFVLGGHEIFR